MIYIFTKYKIFLLNFSIYFSHNTFYSVSKYKFVSLISKGMFIFSDGILKSTFI